jgi:flagellar biosynthesis protein FlhB
MAEGQGGDRTERATPRRREKALEQGQVALSQEVNSTIVLLSGFSLLFASGKHISSILGQNTRFLFSQSHVLVLDNPFALAEFATGNMIVIFKTLAPMLFIIMVSGLFANLLQVGWNVNVSAMAFKWDNINPINGLKQMFSKKSFFELVKNVLKIALIGSVAWFTVKDIQMPLIGSPLGNLADISWLGKLAAIKLVIRLVILMSVIAAMDWGFQKYQHEENIKMTLQEVKQENKDMEGDPQIKARIRAIQLENSRNRMMSDIPTADVVVTNPTHYAVALKYIQGEMAPRVVALGKDSVAQKIKEIARKSRVPVIENVPLARALHSNSEIGAFVPDDLYQAVAEVLAYVYRLKRA